MKPLKAFFLAVLIILPALAIAQPPPVFDQNDPQAVPIDGGVSLLIGAAAVYGAKKAKELKKRRAEVSVPEDRGSK